MITLFKGDDTGGLLGKSVVVEISTEFDLTGCTVIFNYQGIERRWENVHDGDRREVFFSHNETLRMSIGVFKAVILAVDSSGKIRTITNSLPIKVSTNLSECYGNNVAHVTIGQAVNWDKITGKPFEGQEIDIGTDDKVLAALGTIIEKLGGTVKAGIALVALCAMSAFGYTPETHTNSFERDGVTYAQRGGLGAGDYVVTNVNASGDASILPRYLFTLDLDDTYPDDAEWYYEQEDYRDAGGCSVRRVGNTVERNLDWKFNRAAEFIVRVSGNDNRFASLAVANVGEHLTDGFVRSRTPSRYYKCLAGHSTDGINENGVFAEVNVTSGTWGRTTGSVHGLGAVRWVLDHGTNAQQAAEFIADNVYLPEGFGVNFHYLIADADSTYIVENGVAHRIDTQPVVMTNFNLDRQGGEGYERYDSLTNGATITSQWWTLAYSPDTRPIRFSDLGTNYESIWERWADKPKEAHRGEVSGGQTWWQTLHTAIYDLSAKTLRIAVQEIADWYVFGLPASGSGKVRSVNGKVGEVTLHAEDVGAVPTVITNEVRVQLVEKLDILPNGSTNGLRLAVGGSGMVANVDGNVAFKVAGQRSLSDYGITNAIPQDAEDVGALPDDQAQLEANENFRGAVATVSPPVELPEKWALSNVTNEQGQAVTAEDVNALDNMEAYADNDATSWKLKFPHYGFDGRKDYAEIHPYNFRLWQDGEYLDIGFGGVKYVNDDGGVFNSDWFDFVTKDTVVRSIGGGDEDMPPSVSALRTYLGQNYTESYIISRDYLKKSDASNTYETQSHASTTYETQSHASATYAGKAAIADAATALSNRVNDAKNEITVLHAADSSQYINGKGEVYRPSGTPPVELVAPNTAFNSYINFEMTYDEETHRYFTDNRGFINCYGPMGGGATMLFMFYQDAGSVHQWVLYGNNSWIVDTADDDPTADWLHFQYSGMWRRPTSSGTVHADDLAYKSDIETFVTFDEVKSAISNRIDVSTVKIGEGSDSRYSGCVAVGLNAKSTALSGIAIGNDARVISDNSVSVGKSSRSHGANTFNVFTDVGRWYAGDTPVVAAIQSRFVMTNIEEVVTNDTQLLAESPNGSIVTNTYTIYVPDGTGARVAYDDKSSLARMMTDAATNHTEECECISTNICKLAAPAITNAVIYTRDRFYDPELDVTWKRTVTGGRIFYDIEAVGDSTED